MKTTQINLLLLLAGSVAPAAHSKRPHPLIEKYNLRPKPELDSQIRSIRDTTWASALRNAVVVNGCYNPSSEFMSQLVGNIGQEDLVTLTQTGVDMIPMLYSLYRESEGSDEYFGTFGEETKEIVSAHNACKDFWSSATGGTPLVTDNIALLGMHGADMKDLDKLVPMLQLMYDLEGADVTYDELAIDVQDFIESLPHEYDNPILTFNAYASSTEGDERIVMGDGIIEFQHFMNLGNDGPEYILGHEFGHQVQYETNMIDVESNETTTPEESRHIELMADALGGYFLAHDQGGNMEGVRVADLYEAAFAVGDCDATSDGHHGTPSQRECALVWGASKVQSGLSGSILHPDQLATLFDADLPRILALDPTLCQPPSIVVGDIGVTNRNGAGETIGAVTTTTTTTVVTTTTSAAGV